MQAVCHIAAACRSRLIDAMRGLAIGSVFATFATFVLPAIAQTSDVPGAEEPPAASPKPRATTADIDRWISELGHDSYSVRQNAGAQLLAAGMLAREALLELSHGPDPETRAAARRLVAMIDRSEFRRRLDAFAADTDGRKKLSLPGWEEFQALVGNAASARSLFVDMQRQEGALIAAVFGGSKHAPEDLWEARLLRIAQWQPGQPDRSQFPPLGSCAALLFLGSRTEMNVSDQSAQFLESIITRPPISQSLKDNSQTAVRKLAVSWLLQCPNKNDDILRQRMSIIATIGLKEALPLALQVCSGGPEYLRVQPLTKVVGAMIVGQLGGREHVAKLEPLLDDTTVCLPLQTQIPGQAQAVVQVRDVGLCMVLKLTDQQPADYGYTNVKPAQPGTYQLQTMYRDTDAQRAESIAKWRKWREEHKSELAAAAANPSAATPAKLPLNVPGPQLPSAPDE